MRCRTHVRVPIKCRARSQQRSTELRLSRQAIPARAQEPGRQEVLGEEVIKPIKQSIFGRPQAAGRRQKRIQHQLNQQAGLMDKRPKL